VAIELDQLFPVRDVDAEIWKLAVRVLVEFRREGVALLDAKRGEQRGSTGSHKETEVRNSPTHLVEDIVDEHHASFPKQFAFHDRFVVAHVSRFVCVDEDEIKRLFFILDHLLKGITRRPDSNINLSVQASLLKVGGCQVFKVLIKLQCNNLTRKAKSTKRHIEKRALNTSAHLAACWKRICDTKRRCAGEHANLETVC
jgi:hypothetical protein